MKVKCDKCGVEFDKRADKLTNLNFCSRECAKGPRKHITKPCDCCGVPVTRCQSWMLDHVFCSRKCSKGFLSLKMAKMNVDLNPDRMNLETRSKLRLAHLGKGEGLSYGKTFGRHSHRIAAERLLGRPLAKGEVVHHINNDKRNNHPLNLMVFSSQANHAAWHRNEQYNGSKNFE